MKHRFWLLGLLGAAALASADAPSPARAQMEGFIAAFNTGERAKIEAFGRDHMPPDFMRPAIIDDTVQMYERTGGYDVVDVTESDPNALKAHVRERRTKTVVEMTVQVDDAAPQRITTIFFQDSGSDGRAAPH